MVRPDVILLTENDASMECGAFINIRGSGLGQGYIGGG